MHVILIFTSVLCIGCLLEYMRQLSNTDLSQSKHYHTFDLNIKRAHAIDDVCYYFLCYYHYYYVYYFYH